MALSSFLNFKKCPLCDTLVKKDVKFAELRLETADGPINMEICMGCATVLNKSADFLNETRRSETKRKTDEDSI